MRVWSVSLCVPVCVGVCERVHLHVWKLTSVEALHHFPLLFIEAGSLLQPGAHPLQGAVLVSLPQGSPVSATQVL